MARLLGFLLALVPLVAGCLPAFDLPEGGQVGCSSDSDCPEPWVCNTSIKVCQRTLTTVVLPRPAVAYVTPQDGESNVGLDTPIVVIFSMPVLESSLDGRLHLSTGSGPVTFTRLALAPGAFRLTPDAPLAQDTQYTLTVDAGVEGDSLESMPSEDAFSSTFSTRFAGDTTPPGPVSDLRIDVRGPGETVISWTNPTDSDLLGVMILRSTDEAASAVLEDGRLYGINAQIGNAWVVQFGDKATTTWTDATLAPDRHFDYVLFAFDESLNYSLGRSPPLVRDVTHLSCAESGRVTASGPEAGSYQVLFSDPEDVASPVTFPAAATAALGDALALDSAGLVAGTRYTARVQSRNDEGVRLEPAFSYWWLPALLTPLAPPVPIAAGGTAELLFTPYGWESFEAEVDTDDHPGSESYGPAAASAEGRASATMSTAGNYRFRVRPAAAGCPTAPWTESEPFDVEGVVYVSPAGDDTKDGVDPGSAVKTLARAKARVTALQTIADAAGAPRGVDVRVAVGDYPEVLNVLPDARYLGGFDAATFRTRYDPRDASSQANGLTSRIHPDSTTAVQSTSFVTLGPETIIDGFDIEPTATSLSSYGISLDDGATIRHNVISGGTDLSANTKAIVMDTKTSTGLIEENVIDDGAGKRGTAVSINDGAGTVAGEAIIRNNDIVGADGVYFTGKAAAVTIENNRIVFEGAVDPTVSTRYGIRAFAGAGAIRGNRILGSGTYGGSSRGIELLNDTEVRVERNTVFAGKGGASSTSYGLYIDIFDAAQSQVLNNFVHGGAATLSAAIAYDSGDIRVANNTLFAGRGSEAYGIDMLASFSPLGLFVNNLFFGLQDAWVVLARTNDTGGTGSNGLPSAFQHNIAIGVSDPVASDYNQAAAFLRNLDVTPVADYPLATDAEGYLCTRSSVVTASDNASLALDPALVFVDVDGADDDIDTVEDNDWHLVGTATALAEGGRDTSTNNCAADNTACPGTNTRDCGAVTDDVDGQPRTAPFSVGADERDPGP